MRQLLYDNIDQPGLNTLKVYRDERGGYEMLQRALGHLVAPALVAVDLERVEPGLVDVVVEELAHQVPAAFR